MALEQAGARQEREHGGDWKTFLDRYGKAPLDFSASVSPLGMSPKARRAAARSLKHAHRYPDPDCRALREKLSGAYGVKEEWILCANGAGDLIDRLALALRPGRAMLLAPTYGEYRRALERVGCTVMEYRLKEKNGFRVQEDLTEQIGEDLDLVLLCEPNNPTGRTTDPVLLRAIAQRCREKKVFLVLDECFNDFLDQPERHTMLGSLSEYPLLILRGFTKFYGMAGLRLGWCASADEALLWNMKQAGQPWPVSLPAQAAGEAALGDSGYERRLRSLIRKERGRLKEGLEKCGCRVIPGEADYLLFYDSVPKLKETLAGKGILIRSCRSFAGLEEGWYRAAVRRAPDNQKLIQAVREAHRWQTL